MVLTASFSSRAFDAAVAIACLAATSLVACAQPSPSAECGEPPGRAVDARTLRVHAERLVERGEMGEALEAASSAAKLAPGDAESWLLLGSLHAMAGHAPQERTSYAACVARATEGLIEQCRVRLE